MAKEDVDRYLAAAHGMQSGVAFEMNNNPKPTEPKHLRVGINSAMCDHTALVRLLIERGIFNPDEYERAIADEMEREVERYEARAPAGVRFR